MSITIENGVIEQVASRDAKTKFGVKPVYSFKVAGEWYKAGFKKPTFVVGDTVSFEYNVTTYGNEMVDNSAKVGGGAGRAPSPPRTNAAPASSKGAFPIPPLDGQRSIVRQNSVTNAREIVIDLGGAGDTIDDTVQEIIRIAKILEAYSCGDNDLADAKAEVEASKGT